MYRQLALLICVVGVGCSHYPKFVHNKCSGKWAVQAGYGYGWSDYYGGYEKGDDDNLLLKGAKEGILYLGQQPVGLPRGLILLNSSYMPPRTYDKIDTVFNAKIGDEMSFDDSTSAVRFYNMVVRNKFVKDSLYTDAVRIADKKARDQNRHDDSVFICQHSYN